METSAQCRSNPCGIRSESAAGSGALLFSQLSRPRQALVRLCQNINYGSIQGLRVEDAEPALSPPPLVLIDVKLDADEVPRPEADLPDFELCDEVCRLMGRLQELTTGMIERIEVRGGIPRRIAVRGWLIRAWSPLPQTGLADRPASEDLRSRTNGVSDYER